MKKVALLLVLVVALTMALTFTSVCYAATSLTRSNNYYESIQSGGIQAYRFDTNTNSFVKSIIIPYSYFFKVEANAASGYYQISYNGYEELFIPEPTSSSAARATTYDEITDFDEAPAYSLSLSAPDSNLTLYDINFANPSSTSVESLRFVGYAKNEDTYYFLVMVQLPYDVPEFASYVKASDVLDSSFDPANIPIHKNSKEATDEQAAKDVEIAQNMLRRNIFFITICVVCVLVVLLIYNPFKKKQTKKINTNNTSDDEF